MSKDGVDVWLEGERELFANMQKRFDGCTQAGRRGIQKAGLQIVADAKLNLRNNGTNVTGQLSASGRVQKVDDDPDSIDAGFFSQDTRGGYALFVEYGRRAGKFPPIDEIVQWVRKKLRIREQKAAKGIGFLIARKIAKKGTRPHPFFGPAVEKNKNAINDFIAEEVNKETQRNG